jgi:hypothetical protein
MAWFLISEAQENLKKKMTPFCSSDSFSLPVKIILAKGTPFSASL